MRLALFADLHANLEALTTCLEHSEAQGADQWAFLGDLVGYCADPGPVLDIVMAYAQTGAAVVLGNHDAAAVGLGGGDLNPNATTAIEWTRTRLSAAHREFLAGLPLTVRDQDRLFVHASAAYPEKWIYVTDPTRAAHALNAAQVTYVFGGHVHEPVLYYMGADSNPQPFRPISDFAIPVPRHRRWLAIVGSCGQPRDGNPLTCYALFDSDRAEITWHRLPYDRDATARKIRAAGLPEKLAHRILLGD